MVFTNYLYMVYNMIMNQYTMGITVDSIMITVIVPIIIIVTIDSWYVYHSQENGWFMALL